MKEKSFIHSRIFHIGIAAAAALTIGFFAGRSMPYARSAPSVAENVIYSKPSVQTEVSMQTAVDIQAAWRNVVQKALPSVVEIDVVNVVKTNAPVLSSPFDFFLNPQNDNSRPREFTQQGLGSGVIVRQTGRDVFVLTNNHVAGEANEITVKLQDGTSYSAVLVGKDPNKDLALIKFQTDAQVTPADLGDSDALQAGDWVMAVGNPLGFESTVTEGIVSAIGRPGLPGTDTAAFTDYIQTDAAINQGNSGGALVDIYGRVVGINSWIASNSGGNIGLGFSIPINNAKTAINDFISKGRVSYGWLGISMGAAPQSAETGESDNNKVFVFGVYRNSPADKAGILPGDSIKSVNEENIDSSSKLLAAIGNLSPGKTSDITVLRGGKQISLQVLITERSEDSQLAAESNLLWPGMTLVPITREIRERLNLPKDTGKIIAGSVTAGSPAAIAGLRPGDIINSIGSRKISSLDDFYRQLNDPTQKEAVFEVSRQGTTFKIGLVK